MAHQHESPYGEEVWVPASRIDETKPAPARIYDWLLGGKNNYAADREAGARIEETMPYIKDTAWENRRFLQRAVRFLVGEGIRQFIDIGAGLPTQGQVHEIVQHEVSDARVVYVDNDPIVLTHAGLLLTAGDPVTVIQGDLRRPQEILDHPELNRLIDLTKPVAVLLLAVLHFITDEEDPEGILRTLREAMAPGSYLALSHVTTDGPDPEALAQALGHWKRATASGVWRSSEHIRSFFDGFDLVEPGFVRPWQWRPDGNQERTASIYGGVGRKTT
jgi:O-methyltransferase involved in polyketide biosynthesis